MAKPLPTPEQMNARWKAGMATARNPYIEGINRTTVNPMALAASPEALAKYAASTARAAQQGGRMQQGLQRADPNSWKANAVSVGANRLADGATKGGAKQLAAARRLAGYQQAQRAAAEAVGPKTPGNAIARMNAAHNALMQAAGKQ